MREQLLDAYDVRHAILVPLFAPAIVGTQPELQAALAAAYNDWVISEWLSRDSRLKASVCLPPEPADAVREIDRVGGHPQMVQVLFPLTNREWGAPSNHPIFGAAVRQGLVCAFHNVAGRFSSPIPRYYISWHTGYSLAYMAQLISLVHDGVLARFPSLRVLLLEGGWTWLPHVLWRMDRDWRSMRWEVPWVKRRPSEYITEQVWFGTQPMEEPPDPRYLIDMIDMLAIEGRLVFASDYPHWDFDDPDQALPRQLTGQRRRRILFENALALYSQKLDQGVRRHAGSATGSDCGYRDKHR
jgi:predicted TIM-barrel fold metal-dependent hydrolase